MLPLDHAPARVIVIACTTVLAQIISEYQWEGLVRHLATAERARRVGVKSCFTEGARCRNIRLSTWLVGSTCSVAALRHFSTKKQIKSLPIKKWTVSR